MTMNKFLALVPVVAFAAACSGTAPGSPNAVVSNDANEIVSDAASLTTRPCVGLTAINLRVDQSNDSMVWVEASYQFGNALSTPAPRSCAAPTWRADRDDMVIDKQNRFRVGFARQATGRASVQATAPGGVHNMIDLDLSPTNSVRRPASCDNVTGVTMTLMTTSSDSRVAVIAEYVYDGPLSAPCAVAPVWSADRRGLVVNQKNPFLASINADTSVQTTVTSTSPNGAVGNVIF
jgi:hypothetical protein